MGENVCGLSGANRTPPNLNQRRQQRKNHQWPGNSPKNSIPIALVTDVNVGPSFQAVLDGKTQTDHEPRISPKAFQVRMPVYQWERFITSRDSPINDVIGKAVRDADADSRGRFPTAPPVEPAIRPNPASPVPVLQ